MKENREQRAQPALFNNYPLALVLALSIFNCDKESDQ